MDFKSFAKGKGKSQKFDESKVDKNVKKKVEDTVNKFKGKSQDELMQEIMKNAAKQRKEGKLSDADLDKFYKSVAPMLNKEQMNKMKQILKMLK